MQSPPWRKLFRMGRADFSPARITTYLLVPSHRSCVNISVLLRRHNLPHPETNSDRLFATLYLDDKATDEQRDAEAAGGYVFLSGRRLSKMWPKYWAA